MAVAQAALKFYFNGRGDGGLAAGAACACALTTTSRKRTPPGRGVLIFRGALANDEALVEIDAALRLDPESFEVNAAEPAILHAKPLCRRDPVQRKSGGADGDRLLFGQHPDDLLQGHRRRGGNAERGAQRVLARAEKITTQKPDNGLALGYVVKSLCALGQAERAKDLAKRATPLEPDNLTMRYNFVLPVCGLGRNRRRARLLGPVFERDAAETVNWAKVDPDLDALRKLPRFTAMMGQADVRLAAASAGTASQSPAARPGIAR